MTENTQKSPVAKLAPVAGAAAETEVVVLVAGAAMGRASLAAMRWSAAVRGAVLSFLLVQPTNDSDVASNMVESVLVERVEENVMCDYIARPTEEGEGSPYER